VYGACAESPAPSSLMGLFALRTRLRSETCSEQEKSGYKATTPARELGPWVRLRGTAITGLRVHRS
jgi:hypothetical protein